MITGLLRRLGSFNISMIASSMVGGFSFMFFYRYSGVRVFKKSSIGP
jgi:hypothetical protein